jgi:hypothetical protein
MFSEGLVLQELMKLGKIRRPQNAELGTLLVSFLYDGRICRKLCATILNSTAKNDVKVHVRPLNGGQFNTNQWLGIRNRRRRKQKNDFQRSKLYKIEIRAVESAYMPIVAEGLKKDFLGTGCSLLGLKLEVDGRVENWSTRKLLDLEEYQELIKMKQILQNTRNNGGNSSKVKFYEKLCLLYKINLTRTLNCRIEHVDEIYSSVEKELRHFSENS